MVLFISISTVSAAVGSVPFFQGSDRVVLLAAGEAGACNGVGARNHQSPQSDEATRYADFADNALDELEVA